MHLFSNPFTGALNQSILAVAVRLLLVVHFLSPRVNKYLLRSLIFTKLRSVLAGGLSGTQTLTQSCFGIHFTQSVAEKWGLG